ncbi:adenylate kinase [Bacillus phage vB_BpsS-140]|nr:adenylate kinase [Bacillus phage vB_BpsS-140]
MSKRAIVLIGCAGSGKSTMGKLLADVSNGTYISTGDIARRMEAVGLYDSTTGKLAPERLMRMCLEEDLDNASDVVILDGFPRTVAQARYLETIVDTIDVIMLNISREEATSRLIARGRKDDTKENIERRMERYFDSINSILAFIMDSDINGAYKNVMSAESDATLTQAVKIWEKLNN